MTGSGSGRRHEEMQSLLLCLLVLVTRRHFGLRQEEVYRVPLFPSAPCPRGTFVKKLQLQVVAQNSIMKLFAALCIFCPEAKARRRAEAPAVQPPRRPQAHIRHDGPALHCSEGRPAPPGTRAASALVQTTAGTHVPPPGPNHSGSAVAVGTSGRDLAKATPSGSPSASCAWPLTFPGVWRQAPRPAARGDPGVVRETRCGAAFQAQVRAASPASRRCGNVNFARRTSCNRCGREKTTEAKMMKAGGTEIGKTLAEKSRGLFSANDWQCKTCSNVNWARRSECNMCNTPKYAKLEERTGYGGGFNERENVEYIEREESDGEYDEFGRKKKKYRGKAVGPASILKEVEDKESEGEEEDEDEDLSKYKLDEDEDEDDADLSKYNLDASEEEDSNKKKSNRRSRSKSRSSHSRSSSRSSSPSSSRSRSRSRSRSSSSSQSRSRSSSRERSRSRGSKSRSSSRSHRGSSSPRKRSYSSSSSSPERNRKRSRSRSSSSGDRKKRRTRSRSPERRHRSSSGSSQSGSRSSSKKK
ncbi:zinc finger Ran-binding domain-containing protein 2 [Carlito syrichta]|uniref:Zinc finger Ran-binding domain-containing protein 2 n=2 Tax=Boreoeutheria TaxID=1437010 RepID=A0A3Q0DV18_CARSF|nr:zinc finger Ran-binding domain-containing protein 2 [Carlito syrichta]